MDWDQFVQRHAGDGGLLQSSSWAKFQRGLGRTVDAIVIPAKAGIQKIKTDRGSLPIGRAGPISVGDDTAMVALIIEHRFPFGQSYVYSPRGPVTKFPISLPCWQAGNFQFSMNGIVSEIRKKFPKAIYWRVEPPYENFQFPCLAGRQAISNFQLRSAPHNVQPATTLIIDLSTSEEELLAQMKQKTRYNIKISQRHGVRVSVNSEQETVNNFLDLLEETAKRDGFRVHPRGYYQKFLTLTPTLSQGERGLSIELFGAFHGDQLLAGAIVAFYGKWAYYLHGASSSGRRDLMAPYFLHWEIMREAKRRGCTKYDFWGAGDEWPGVSKFKTGFAPATALTHYPGTFDIVLDRKKYFVYRAFQTIRRLGS
ncbi:peptidoglycan bridge formation glycyltransferase FemA/FemB family protein [Candidatus Uhrbacteria bacterium]|nr:peptidoglycan bridge formation glycyltransferase FemA/FemB family protein [Candidatus Uhrbacteria bacterium]